MNSHKISEHELQIDSDPHMLSLSSLIAIYVGFVLVLGMTVYALFQYLLSDTHSVWALVLEHLTHVMFLILPVFIMLWVVLHKKVVTPIQVFKAKLYYLASGDMTHINIKSNIREISELTDAINLMLDRIQKNILRQSIIDLAPYATELRSLAGKNGSLEVSDRAMLMTVASDIKDIIAMRTKDALWINNGQTENT